MGKRGVAPKPTNLRILHGEPNKARINRNEPQPSVGKPVAPDWLSDKACEVWDRLAPDLIAKKVLTGWDVDEFANFCAMVVLNREAHQKLAVDGASSASGKHPAWQIARETSAVMVSIGGRFGLTPSDRAQLSIGKADESDLESLLSDG